MAKVMQRAGISRVRGPGIFIPMTLNTDHHRSMLHDWAIERVNHPIVTLILEQFLDRDTSVLELFARGKIIMMIRITDHEIEIMAHRLLF